MAVHSDTPHCDDTPYCNECGYSFVGLAESAKCPQCGKPIVDVLVRAAFPGQAKRYTSGRTFFGLPVLTIASGARGAERCGNPVGIVAIGDKPRGVIAIGGLPVGVIAVGGVARGVIALGGFAFGALSFGGFSLGIVAFGGIAVGIWAFGGLVLHIVDGWGGVVRSIWPW